MSELLASALHHDEPATLFSWTTRRMDARVDLEDKESVRGALSEQ